MLRFLLPLLPCLLLLTAPAGLRADVPWPQWRGPRGDGHASCRLPVTWGDEHVKWRVALKGEGQSTPVVWGDRIFLTSAVDGGRQRLVMCLDRHDGQLLWEHVAWTGRPEKSHQMNGWASATCVTDGERVVAFFGKGGLHCYDQEGNRQWSRQLGPFTNLWGTAASPVIVDDLVVQNCDAEGTAFLLAVDKHSGEDVWRTRRQALRGWSTPLLVEEQGVRELALNGEDGVYGYDVKSGAQLWFCKGDRGRGTPTVTPTADNLLVAVSGRAGDMIAVRPGGRGTVNATHEVWRTKRPGGRDLPSPIAIGSRLLVVNLRPGVASCYEAATGQELAKRRLDGAFAASPVASGGLAYLPNEEGEVFVLSPESDDVVIVARNRIKTLEPDEIFRACITPLDDGQLLIRSNTALYFVEAPLP